MWIKQVADGTAAIEGMEADTEAALRRTRRLFVNRDNLRAAIRTVVNKALEVRDVSLWGPGHGVRVGLAQLRFLVGELHDRVVPAPRQRRDHGVLARGM